ncbi:hypothetical protein DFJ73DRAFT_849195 [Zopfochytrium polystomum]|nr:hypothetical protein DFJ73DRAFT_849195 [Zopfochytrium polystomum]
MLFHLLATPAHLPPEPPTLPTSNFSDFTPPFLKLMVALFLALLGSRKETYLFSAFFWGFISLLLLLSRSLPP